MPSVADCMCCILLGTLLGVGNVVGEFCIDSCAWVETNVGEVKVGDEATARDCWRRGKGGFSVGFHSFA